DDDVLDEPVELEIEESHQPRAVHVAQGDREMQRGRPATLERDRDLEEERDAEHGKAVGIVRDARAEASRRRLEAHALDESLASETGDLRLVRDPESERPRRATRRDDDTARRLVVDTRTMLVVCQSLLLHRRVYENTARSVNIFLVPSGDPGQR